MSKKLFQEYINIDNTALALPDFSFPGIEKYSARAMWSKGICILPFIGDGKTEAMKAVSLQFKQMKKIGLGAKEVVFVTTDELGNLYSFPNIESPLNDNAADEIVRLVHGGYKIRPFIRRQGLELDFVKQLGLREDSLCLIEPRVADGANNKIAIRERAIEMGYQDLFPPFEIAYSKKNAKQAALQLIAEYDQKVIIKLPCWASGLGQTTVANEKEVNQCLSNLENYPWPEGVLIEIHIGEHTPASQGIAFYEQAVEQKVVTWESVQMCKGLKHIGNILGQKVKEMHEKHEDFSRKVDMLMQSYVQDSKSSHGILVADMMFTYDGKAYLCEFNCRKTETSTQYELHKQCEELAREQLTSMIFTINLKSGINRCKTLQELVSFGYDGHIFILPYLVTTIEEGSIKVFVAAEKYDTAREAMEKIIRNVSKNVEEDLLLIPQLGS